MWIEVGSQPAQVAGRRLLVDWGVDERRIALPQSDDVLPELTHNLSAESATDPEYRVALKYCTAELSGGVETTVLPMEPQGVSVPHCAVCSAKPAIDRNSAWPYLRPQSAWLPRLMECLGAVLRDQQIVCAMYSCWSVSPA